MLETQNNKKIEGYEFLRIEESNIGPPYAFGAIKTELTKKYGILPEDIIVSVAGEGKYRVFLRKGLKDKISQKN